MKNTMKRVVAVMAALLMVAACFVACDKQEGGDNVLVIGGTGPLSGDAASYGISVQNGAQIAVDEINAAGGVNGITFKLEMVDDQADSEKASANFGTLMDKGMKASIGGVTSGAHAAFADAASDTGLLMITPSASAEDCIKQDYAFRICFSDPEQGVEAANFIKENALGTKIAVIHDSSDTYSTGLYDAFIAQAKELGLEIVADEAFTKDTNTDFSSQIAKAKDGEADLVFLPIYYQQAAAIITQADGILADTTKYVGCDGLDGLIGVVDDAALIEGVTLITPFFADSAEEPVASFVKAYKEKHDATPDQFAADAYDAVYAIKAAIEKAGVTDVNDADLNSKLIAAMTEIEVKGTTGTMTWDASGAPTKNFSYVTITDGKYVKYGE